MDKIFLKGMEFYGYHGAYPAENELGQRFRVDVECFLDLREACQSDQLEHTINYADLYRDIQRIMEEEPYVKLLEHLAEKISQRILSNYVRVIEVSVRIIKPDPPIRGHYEYVGVEIHRRRVT